MKAVIFGVGRMGTVIAFAMKKLGYSVVGVDFSSAARENLSSVIGNQDFTFYQSENIQADQSEILSNENPDIVISSMPYHQNLPLAKYCILNGYRYCDLGGSVPVSQEINNLGIEKASKPIMTDLGLAPGWVNIITEWGCKSVYGTPDDIKMMVGGIPTLSDVNAPLNYATTWSVDGLINEYRDDCEILSDGEIKIVKGMEGHERVYVDWIGQRLEAFYTSGGASHSIPDMKSRGVKNCSYKTIRYAGHRDIIKFLIRDCKLPDEALRQIFLEGCAPLKDIKDIVIIKSLVRRGDLKWSKELVISADNKFSAMQKATAFPISSVAALMAKGVFDDRKIENRSGDIKLPIVLSYKDIPQEGFTENLTQLGLSF
jgi:saccharopine dehydrogenase-like NADP-dependent oxidoreductase